MSTATEPTASSAPVLDKIENYLWSCSSAKATPRAIQRKNFQYEGRAIKTQDIRGMLENLEDEHRVRLSRNDGGGIHEVQAINRHKARQSS